MNLLILEDEPLAAERLIGLIQKNNPGVNILRITSYNVCYTKLLR